MEAEGPWKWVAKERLTGGDLIPLGARSNYPGEPGYTPGAPNDFDSHICFASRPVTVKTPAGSHEALYYMGGNGRAPSALGFDRIVVSEIEAPIIPVNQVQSG
jgi:hypothetical protein